MNSDVISVFSLVIICKEIVNASKIRVTVYLPSSFVLVGFKLTEGFYSIIHKRTMMTHCYLKGIRLVMVKNFHTSGRSARTWANTGVVGF